VPSFKEVNGDLFTYEGNRAIVFRQNETVPEVALKNCPAAGLMYHQVRNLPLLELMKKP
jgi:hypothetical protein